MMPEKQKTPRKLPWLPTVGAVLAFVACNGVVVIVAMLSLVGITIVINPHLQAAAISLFALLTLGFVFLSYKKHRNIGPLIVVGVGAVIIIFSMYVTFNKIIESIGLFALLVSALWSWWARKAHAPSAFAP